MNLLVTGGAGFIGSNLLHYLLNDAESDLGCRVDRLVNLDSLTYAGNPDNLVEVAADPRYVFVQGDICDASLVTRLFVDHRIDRVVHLAAESHVDRSIDAPQSFLRTNVLGTYVLLDAFRSHSTAKARFLHVSTDEVFGSLGPRDPRFTEAAPYAPNSPYSATKAGSDHLARAWHHTYGVPVVTTFSSNNYGPRQFPEKLIPLMIRKALKGEPMPVYGDGGNIRDWLYVRDHCRGLVMALLQGTPGDAYAFGGNCEMRNIDVVKAIVEVIGELAPSAPIRSTTDAVAFVKDRPGHDRRYAIDASKAELELGWKPQETFESGIRRTVRWYLDNEPWVRRIEDGCYRGERLGLSC